MTLDPDALDEPVGQDEETVDAHRLLEKIEDMLAGDYGWASDTLTGIYNTIERTHYATEAQQTAVRNIREGGIRGRRSRR